MPEYKTHIRAALEPSDTKLLTNTPTYKLLTESPKLASALSQIFPYLLLIDNFLEIITWTNDDHFQNFLIMTGYSCIVVYWDWISHVILPILLTIAFASIVWSISSVIYDSKYDEKPTIDEVLYTLHNITVRSEMLLRPIQHVPFKTQNFIKMLIAGIILTPVNVAVMKTIITPQKYLWFLGLFLFTFHSPYAFAIRRLLWRSLYVRLAILYATGLEIKVSKDYDTSEFQTVSRVVSAANSDAEGMGGGVPVLSDFKVLKKRMISPTQLKQTVLFEVLENERRWLGIGWSSLLYPSERPNFCYAKTYNLAPNITGMSPRAKYPFPIFENDLYSYLWQWIDDEWTLELEFDKSKTRDGWVYYNSSWEDARIRDGFSRYTRSRRWTRRATLIIDKRETVYDE
ncbi:Peroxisomal membrane protein PEX30 [Candida viswanathii]|uniref:Peroxisomal membrane protein PEX30 n=1 Tax=Candida viswanathii TaxID=5486 RepID=A0A367XSY3_9ASCO|nr:Peroxisomal membrane protein PEX30 [Candida viswanathii]